MEATQVIKKIAKITGNVLLYLFIAACILIVVLTISSKKDIDGTTTVFGKQMRSVISPSMEKCDQTDVSAYEIKDIPVGSMVFIDVVPEDPEKAAEWYADLKVGDVLTFKYVYVKQETITHRIVDIQPNANGGYTIKLEGDNKGSDSDTLTQTINTASENSLNYVIGKVTGQSLLLGKVESFISSPYGLIFVVIIPCVIIVMLEVIKIAKVLSMDKRKKEREQRESQKNEIEALKRKLAQLEQSKKQK